MESVAILKIRLTGIIGCINTYTSEPTISSIIDALATALGENDFDIILFSCKELKVWYQKNISAINSNQFVFNKEVHSENRILIDRIISDLEENCELYKEQFDSSNKSVTQMGFDTKGLIHLLNRFHRIVVQLRDRYNDRDTLDVSDEYDVQDLLHALLRVYCDDIRPEEWTPSYAGTSSRQDFLLKKEQIVIEIKKTRKGLGNKELADQLIIDMERYKSHPNCKTLVCFVYDPENRVKNPQGFENDLTKETDGVNVIVCIRP